MRTTHESLKASVSFDTGVLADLLDEGTTSDLFSIAAGRRIIIPFEVITELLAAPAKFLPGRARQLRDFLTDSRVVVLRECRKTICREAFGLKESIKLSDEKLAYLNGLLVGIESGNVDLDEVRNRAQSAKSDLLKLDEGAKLVFKAYERSDVERLVLGFGGLRSLDSAQLREVWFFFKTISTSFREFKNICKGQKSRALNIFYNLFWLRLLLNTVVSNNPKLSRAQKIHRNNYEDILIATAIFFVDEFFTTDGALYDFLNLARTACSYGPNLTLLPTKPFRLVNPSS